MGRFPICERTLTGRMRVRRGWFGRMVLQVQIVFRGRLNVPGEWVTCWRDATWEDLQELPWFVIGPKGLPLEAPP